MQKFALQTALVAVAIALLGATHASATVLCESEKGEPCTALVKAGAKFHAELETGTAEILSSSFQTIKCKKMVIEGKTTSSGGKGESVKGEITAWTFAECFSSVLGACTVTAVGLPYAATFTATAKGNGTMEVPNGSKATNCNGTICNYVNPVVTRTIEGGHPGHFVEKTTWQKAVGSNAGCSATLVEENRTKIDTPTWLWVWPF
jgi:hypothetical protein